MDVRILGPPEVGVGDRPDGPRFAAAARATDGPGVVGRTRDILRARG